MNNYNNHLPVMLTIRETAKSFGIAEYRVRQLALSGQVRAIRCGRKILVNADSLAELFNNSTLTSDEEQYNTLKPIPSKLR